MINARYFQKLFGKVHINVLTVNLCLEGGLLPSFFFLIQVLVKQGVCGNIFRLKSVASNAFQTTTDIGIIVQPMLQPRTKPVEKQPRSSYPVLLKITRELYTLFQTKTTLNRGCGGGFLFLFRGDSSMAQNLEDRRNCLNSFA